MKKIIMSLGLLIIAQGASISVCAGQTWGMDDSVRALIKKQEEELRVPKLYVMSERVSYPAVMIVKTVQEKVPDDLLIEELLPTFRPEDIAKSVERLKVIRELTPEEVEQKKKQYEQTKIEREKQYREFEAIHKRSRNE